MIIGDIISPSSDGGFSIGGRNNLHYQSIHLRTIYGYRWDRYHQLVLHPVHADVVRLIYMHYADGASLLGIKRVLDSMGIQSPYNRTTWSRETISSILQRKQYAGLGEYPQIVDDVLYAKVELAMGERNEKLSNDESKSRYSSTDALSGLLICGECGKTYRRITGRNGKITWRCANRVEHGREHCPDSVTMKDETIRIVIHAAYYRDTSSDKDDSRYVEQWIRCSVAKIVIRKDNSLGFEWKDHENTHKENDHS